MCHASRANKIKGLKGQWAAIDPVLVEKDLDAFSQVNDVKPILTTQEFQNFVSSSRDLFTEWVDSNLASQTVLDQLLSPISRSPFLDFYRETMWVLAVASRLEAIQCDIIVVTRSVGVRNAFRKLAKERGIEFSSYGAIDFLLSGIANNCRAILRFSYDFTIALTRVAASRAVLGHGYIKKLQNITVLLDVFILAGDIKADGKVRHRYYPGLIDLYERNKIPAAYYPIFVRVSLYEIINQYRGIKSSECIFVPPELFLRIADVFAVAFSCIFCSFSRFSLADQFINKTDIAPISDALRFKSALSGILTLLQLKTPKRLNEFGIRPRLFLDWFENQPIDQATSVGFKSAIPECKLIAVRPYAIYSRNLLSYQVTTREVDQGFVPLEHWIGGATWINIASTYDAAGKYSIIPSFRSARLFDYLPSGSDGNDLVVLLPYSLSDSLRILQFIYFSGDTLSRSFGKVRIKLHPTLSMRVIRNRLRRCSSLWQMDNVIWESDVDVISLVTKARLALSSGTSAALEFVAMGVPVVLVSSWQHIDLSPSEFIDVRMYRTVYNFTQYEQVINEWSPRHPLSCHARIAIGRAMLNECFVSTTDSSMNKFVCTLVGRPVTGQ